MEYELTDVTKRCSKMLNEIQFLNMKGDKHGDDSVSTDKGMFTLRHFANVFRGKTCKKATEQGAFEKLVLLILNSYPKRHHFTKCCQ
jgi:hypothetical protein